MSVVTSTATFIEARPSLFCSSGGDDTLTFPQGLNLPKTRNERRRLHSREILGSVQKEDGSVRIEAVFSAIY